VLLTYVSIAWMAGVFLASRVALPLFLWGLIALLPLCVAWLWRRSQTRVRLAALCGLFYCVITIPVLSVLCLINR